MEKEIAVLIMEPERIVGLELQLELENKGYTVFHHHHFKKAEEFSGFHRIKAIIVNIDQVNVNDFIQVKKQFPQPGVLLIAISSGTQPVVAYNGLRLDHVFFKPFDSKDLVSYIGKFLKKNHSLGHPKLNDRKYFDV